MPPPLSSESCIGEIDNTRPQDVYASGFYHHLHELTKEHETLVNALRAEVLSLAEKFHTEGSIASISFAKSMSYCARTIPAESSMGCSKGIALSVGRPQQPDLDTDSVMIAADSGELVQEFSGNLHRSVEVSRETNSMEAGHVSSSLKVSSLKTNFNCRSEWFSDTHFEHIGEISYSKTTVLHNALRQQFVVGPVLILNHTRYSNCIADPGSWKRLTWDLLTMIFLSYDTLTIPFILSFELEEAGVGMVLKWISVWFWTLDIGASFITGYQTRKKIVLEPAAIAKHYLRFYFWLDFLMVSLDWIVATVGQSSSQGTAARMGRTIRILKLLKTLRLLRTMKFKKYVQAVQDEISSESVSIWFGIFRSVLIFLLANHIIACLWYTIGQIDCDCLDPGWVEANRLKKYPITYRYTTALHWSLAQFTPAPNNIAPQNEYEKIFAIVVLSIALVAFSAFVSTVTSGVLQLQRIRNVESRQFWQLRRYLRDWHVRKPFRKRLIAYLEYAFERQQRRVQEQDVELLKLLSDPLRDDLRHETLREHLTWHPLFLKMKREARFFAQSLGTEFFGISDVVFHCGDEAKRMIFVGLGQLEYILGHLSTAMVSESDLESSTNSSVDYIQIGHWVSEMTLWISSWIHLGDLLAKSEAQIITIDANKFAEAVRSNKPLWQRIASYAKLYLQRLQISQREEMSDLMLECIPPQDLLYGLPGKSQ